MPRTRTSRTDPLHIAEIAHPTGGCIGVTLLPGKHQPYGLSGHWKRDLGTDIDVIRRWGASQVVTLVEAFELCQFGVPGLGNAVEKAGLHWRHLPIPDATAPDADWEAAWTGARADIHNALRAGGKVLLHCRGGLGRAGTVAARILIEAGVERREAMRQVRQARPGAIETQAQQDYLMTFRIEPEAVI